MTKKDKGIPSCHFPCSIASNMAPSNKSKPSGKKDEKLVSKSSSATKGKLDSGVQVIKCPFAFPISTKSKSGKRPRDSPNATSNRKPNLPNNKNKKQDKSLLDWHDTVKEIRAFGATAFEGKQKRDFQDEQYFKLTGRQKKKPQTPLPIARGIKKAAIKREARAREEARQAGIILPKTIREPKKRDKTYDNFGPAPSIGFVKGGVYKVQNKKQKT